jgi:hypothetical protein
MKDILELVEHDILHRDLRSTGEKNRSERKNSELFVDLLEKVFHG